VKAEMKFSPWSLSVTGALVFLIYLFVFGTMMQNEKPLWLRDCIWVLVPIGGILSAISLIKAEHPRGLTKSVLFALHLGNLALAICLSLLLLVALPGIINGTAR
jgi:hypothetical protein